MKKLVMIAVATLGILATSVAQRGQRENASLKDERGQVAIGVRNGTISKAEAKRIKKEAKDVQQAKRRAIANDGTISKREQRRIARQDRELDATIRKSRVNRR